MNRFLLFAIVVVLGALLFYARGQRHPNPWVIRSDHAYDSKKEGHYSWEYRGDPVLVVTDPLARNLHLSGTTAPDKEQFWLADRTNILVALTLDSYWFRGTVEGQKVELRPGAKIVLQK
jgi:hypothetical protein